MKHQIQHQRCVADFSEIVKGFGKFPKRIGELDRLFIRSYEDNVSGKIDDERFAMMNKSYTQEQKDLKAEVINLQQIIEEQER